MTLTSSDNLVYCDHLFNDTTDGYISFLEINNKSGERFVRPFTADAVNLKSIAIGTAGRTDIYVSPNTYFVPKRLTGNIRQYRSLFIDLDVEKHGKFSKEETFALLLDLVIEGLVPMPSMVTDSGRGFHVYFRIKNAPKQAIQTFQELEDYLYYQMKDLGADLSATDSARVLRLPGTVNSRNNETCRILFVDNSIEYSMYDLREMYLHYGKKKPEKVKAKEPKSKKKCEVKNLFNSYSLHITRVDDIKTLCRLRGYKVEGSRNFILCCFSYWNGIYIRDEGQLLSKTMEFNGKFKKPLPESEIRSICKSVGKTIEKFIDYEQGLRSGATKRVTKGMRDKPGYWFTNTYLIKRLDITDEEQKHLKTIIDLEEKYRRRNTKRAESRRNENGLTARQQSKQDKIMIVKELYAKGMTQDKIAGDLNIRQGTVSKYLAL